MVGNIDALIIIERIRDMGYTTKDSLKLAQEITRNIKSFIKYSEVKESIENMKEKGFNRYFSRLDKYSVKQLELDGYKLKYDADVKQYKIMWE